MAAAGRPLTLKQQLFVEEYLVDLNATQAAIRAGYSKRSARQIGAEYLSKPSIQEAIATAKAERLARVQVEQDEVVAWLAAVLRVNVSDVVNWGPDGVELSPSVALPEETLAAVKEVSEGPNGRIRVSFHDKTRAAELLGKHLGMFVERHAHEHSGTVGLTLAQLVDLAGDPDAEEDDPEAE